MKKKPVGRPRRFKSPDEMLPLIGKYCAEWDAKEQPYCVPGLAYSLGFSRRQSPADYARKYPEFASTIKRAMLKIESQRNIQLLTEGNAAGKIFDLCNNFGWVQPHKIEHSYDEGPDRIIVEYYNQSKNRVERAEGNISEILRDVEGATRGLPNRTQRKL